jgi:hypothetical protein
LSWERVHGQAEWHQLIPLVHHHLGSLGAGAVPGPVRLRWQALAQAVRLRNLRLTADLLSLAELFRREGVAFAALKGPVLATTLYGDLGRRTFVDLDILVSPRDFARAREVLVARRFEPDPAVPPSWEAWYARRFCERAFRRVRPDALVDLHWRLMPPGYSFAPATDDLLRRVVSVSVGPATVPALGPEDTLFYLCLHGAKHNWDGLRWLCDLAEHVRAYPATDWDRLLGWAARAGALRLVRVSLHLAHAVLGAPLPADVRATWRGDHGVAGLARRAAGALFSGHGGRPQDWPWKSVFYLSMERLRDRFCYVHDVILAPSVVEQQSLGLPASLSSLYYLIRPFRLLWKELGSAGQ